MRLRCNTLLGVGTSTIVKKTLVFLLVLSLCPAFAQNPDSPEALKKEANNLFKEEQYNEAYKLYSQLVSNYPKDAEYNYRLGVCMIFSEPDKKKCLPYLKFAAGSTEPVSKELKFYLGKAYHINYQFDEAIKAYNDFKSSAPTSLQKKLQVDHEIQACAYGKHLLSNVTDLIILNKVQLPENDYFRSYKKIGGKLLVKPDEFKTSADKKKKEKSVIFMPNGNDVVYFSSYGDNPENGKDIYTAHKLSDGTFSKAEKVAGINTEFDEDYPFLHPNGKSLYFASKGHNSMGGYDIFRSNFDESTNTWGAPLNMEFPVNSPDDDYLFVTDSLEKVAYFSTGRRSPPGKIDVLKIKTVRKPIDLLVVKGAVEQGSPEHALNSVITVKDLFTQDVVATYTAQEDGNYKMELPNGGKLFYTVETPGLETQSAQVSLPEASVSKPYRQSISYENGKLKVLNYFDEPANDNNYLDYLEVIENKAKLEVNTDAKGSLLTEEPVAKTEDPALPKEKPKPSVVSDSGELKDSPKNIVPDKSLSNKQLASLARQESNDLRKESTQLKRDAEAALASGEKQKEEADKKLTEANTLLSSAESISNEDEKKSTLEKGEELKNEAEQEQAMASRILSYSEALKEDYQNIEKEAALNDQYAQELDKSGKSKKAAQESTKKLNELQQQIKSISEAPKKSDEILTSIKTDADTKEKELVSLEQNNANVKSNLDEIKTAISEKETELSKTRKKAAKQSLSEQINELKQEQAEKETQLAANAIALKNKSSEVEALKNGLDLATKIKTEDLAAPVTKNTSGGAEKTANQLLEEKYASKIRVNDPSSTASIEASNTELANFNTEIEEALKQNKSNLVATKNQAKKQQINNDIKELETLKKQNFQKITDNLSLLANMAKNDAQVAAIKTNFEPLSASSATEAVSKLEALSSQLNGNENENFDYNSYQNPKSQTLKVEADARINDAIARQKKLKEDIETSRSSLSASAPATETAPAGPSADQLSAEAEELQKNALQLRNEAKNKKRDKDKEKLIAEAVVLEEKATDKQIEAAEVTRMDNATKVATNFENVQNLLREEKSNEADTKAAKALNDEAKLAFRKAAEMRTEANSLSNKGAKLGNYSNAEEKEAEAIQKQQAAIDLLLKSNPSFALKKPGTNGVITENTPVSATQITTKLEAVNTGLTELAAIKIDSYQKLYEANEMELQVLNSNISTNQNAIDSRPSLKTDYIAATNKSEDAKTLKQNSESAANSSDKLANLIAAVKKQNQSIKQYNSLSLSINEVAVNDFGNAETETTTPVETPPTAETSEFDLLSNINLNNPDPVKPEVVKPTPTKPETTTATANAKPATTKKPKNKKPQVTETTNLEVASNEPIADAAIIETTQLAKTDTTTEQILNSFETNLPFLRNEAAHSTIDNSIAQIKSLEAEQKSIDRKLKLAEKNNADSAGTAYNAEALDAQANTISDEAEDLNNKAEDLKKEAESKNGEEKNYTLAKARELEIQAQDKRLEAADINQESHELVYNTNTNAIKELMEKLKQDDPTKFAELDDKVVEYGAIRKQIRNLRDEANALTSKPAKLGAISNAEEKEHDLIQKQNEVLNQLKEKYPDYVIKPVAGEFTPEELKAKKDQLTEKHFTELTSLVNAFSLEYESSKNSIPKKLNDQRKALKQNAEDLNAESKRLLIKSSQEKDPFERMKLLTLAAKSGNAAIKQLDKILPAKKAPSVDLAALQDVSDRISAVEDNSSTNGRSIGNPNGVIKIDGLEVVQGNAYSAANPIPMNAKVEDGLVFRVQIGAFKTQLPNNAFKGLSPLNGETTPNGYFRYTAGNFNRLENANAVKNDLRGLGYSDAFVVVYYNGRRITLAEALEIMNKEGKPLDPNAPQTAGITANINVPVAPANTAVQEAVVVTKELEKIDGLLYTIQIGVFTRQITKTQLLNLQPIFAEPLSNGLFRYTAGIYNNPERLLGDKQKVVDLGVKDAFVSAYLNGKRIPFAEAKEKQTNDANLKLEPESPIIFPSSTGNNNPGPEIGTLFEGTSVPAFSNGVVNYPKATAENGVKNDEEGISFKVQIGAFSKEIPADIAEKFYSIRTWPVEHEQIGALFIYNVGNFTEAKFAKNLKEELSKLGIADAFITVYKDGRKLYGVEAESHLK